MKNTLLSFLLILSLSGYSQEAARIIELKTSYSIQEDKSIIQEEFVRIKILSEKGYRNALFIDYTDRFRKIESARIEVYDANNKKIKTLKKGDGIEFGFNPSYEISDAKTFFIDPNYKNYPFVVEISSKLKLNGFISLPTWIPRDQFDLAVDHAELSIAYPEAVKVNFKDEFVTAIQSTKDGKILRKYEVSNLPSVSKKLRYQDFYNEQPRVYMSPQKFWLDDAVGSNASWADFGNWFYELNNTPCQLTKETKTFIDGLSRDNRKLLIQKIYEFMQDKTRYVSIQLGIGGFKSLPTEEVEKFGYGDCKALSTYMKNMLDYAGIKSNYILTRAGADVPDVIGDFPGNQFNHVYIGVPMAQDTVYLECTSQEAPYNYTGTFTDDRNVLWIESKASKVIRSRTYNHEVNKRQQSAEVKLDVAGNASIKLDVTNQGIFFDELMLFKAAPADRVAQHNHAKFDYADFTIKDFKYKQPDRAGSVFNANYLLQVNGLAKSANDKIILPMVMTSPLGKYMLKDDLMKYCSIKRGLQIQDEVIVNLPTNYWAYQLPGPEKVLSKFGEYELNIEMLEDKLMVKRKFTFYKGDYRKSDYEEFQVFFKKLEKIESKKIVLSSKT